MDSVSWQQLAELAPELADFGRERLDGKVAYLATIRTATSPAAGWPRTHPVRIIVGAGRCFFFSEPDSPKARDLLSSGRYCLHCAMSDGSGSSGEFQVTGMAVQITDPQLRAEAEAVSSFRPAARALMFELRVGEALATSYPFGRPERHRFRAAEHLEQT